MKTYMLARSRAARIVAIHAALCTGVCQSAAGIVACAQAAHSSLASLPAKIQGHVVGTRHAPLLGPAPGRDEYRAAWWPPSAQRDALGALLHAGVAVEIGDLFASTLLPFALGQDAKSRSGQPGKAPGEGSISVGPDGPAQQQDAGQSPTEANSNTGNLLTSRRLVSWTSLGDSAVDFVLHHNSLGDFSGAFGRGWSHSYDARITYIAGHMATLRMADGLTVPYVESGGTFLPPVGWYHALERNGDGSWTLRYHDQRRDRFDPQGRLLECADRAGNTTRIVRDATGRIASVGSADGRKLLFQYGGDGRVRRLIDPAARRWEFSYNQSGQLVSIAYPGDQGQPVSRSFAYNTQHDITAETDLRGGTWRYSYDGGGRVLTSTDPLGNRTSFTYTATSTSVSLPNGQTTTHNYSNGLLVSTVDAAGFSESFVYDSARNVVQHVDKRGYSLYYTYDARGNVLASTDAMGDTWTYTYSEQNDLLSETTPLGNTTQYRYHPSGGIAQITDPLGRASETNEFDQHGQLTASADALLRTTTYQYDGHGNLVEETAPGGVKTAWGHDILGRTITESLAGGKPWTAVYDALGRHVATFHPDGTSVTWSYDGEGAMTRSVNELGAVETWVYDLAGRLASYTNPLGQTRTYQYDANGWQTRVIDPKGHSIVQGRTPRGELAWQVLGDGTHEAWTYLGTGEVASYTIGGRTTNYSYDAVGRPVGADYPTSPDVSVTYDAEGRRTQMADSTGTTVWEYDAAGQTIRLSQPAGVTEYGYDASGAVVSLHESGRGTTTTTYDAAGRVRSVTNSFAETTTFEYDSAGLLAQIVYANGVREDWAYDKMRRPVVLNLAKADGTTILSQEFEYDAASRLVRMVRNGAATDYAYDALGQLTKETRQGYDASYTYDANGNRLTRTVNGTTESYSYDAGDKLVSVVWPGGSKAYTYDSSGRTTSVAGPDGITTYSYDDESRLVSVASPVGTTNHAYNGLDALVGRNSPEGGWVFHRDGAEVTDPVLFDGSSSYTPSVSVRSGAGTRFLHSDTKNFLLQSDSAQAPVSQRSYDAFGIPGPGSGIWRGTGGYGGVFGYAETGELHQVGHRVYDATTGRFLTRDPVADGRNWYAYGSGLESPTNIADPDGLTPKVIVVILVIRGVKHVYKVYKTAKRAKEAAKLAKKGGKIRKDAGHHGGPRHYHNEGQRKNIHYTTEAAAKEAKRRGAPHWRNFDPSRHHQVLQH